MKAKDLRIGDYICVRTGYYRKKSGIIKFISEISCLVEISEDEAVEASFEDIEAIPLTEEILLLNQFVQHGEPLKCFFERNYGETRVSVCLHIIDDVCYSYDFWIEKPYCSDTQTKASNVWNTEQNNTFYKLGCRPTCGDAIGIHILQHAMTFAEIEEELIISNNEENTDTTVS